MRNITKRRILNFLGIAGQARRFGHYISSSITALILLNFIGYVVICQWHISPAAVQAIHLFGDICVAILIVEVAVRITWDPHDFFHGKNAEWNIFDLIVTVLSALAWLPWIIDIPASGIIIFRSMRIFRLLRLFSRFNRIRTLLGAMFSVKSDFLWVSAVLAIITSLYAVLGTLLYSDDPNGHFSTFSESVFTLFQIMTLDGWATDEARPLMELHPTCWLYFVSFAVITAFIILNVVTGIIVDAMSEVSRQAGAERLHKRHMFEHDVDFCLSNNEYIDDQESDFLRRKAKEYGLKDNEAETIMAKAKHKFKLAVKEYQDLVRTKLMDTPNIDAKQRHHLNRKQRELNIDSRIALDIEQKVRAKLYPQVELNEQEIEFKEFYRALINTKEQMATHFGVRPERVQEIRDQLSNEGANL